METPRTNKNAGYPMTQSLPMTTENQVTAGLVGSGDLLALIRSEPDPDLHIFRWGGKWEVTNEWLCGGFAGRSFVGDKPEQAEIGRAHV